MKRIHELQEQGYVVVPRLFGPDEVASAMAEIPRLLGEHAALFGLPSGSDDPASLASLVLCIHHPHKLSERLRALAAHPALVAVLRELIGPCVKCLQSQLFIKPPGFPGNAWHQDERPIATRDRSLLATWIALDDATLENGCLRVVPRSHTHGYLYPERAHGRPDEFDFPTTCYGFDEEQQVAVELSAGDAIFFHGYLVHGSPANRSRGPRRCLTYHYMNAFSPLPWKIRARPDQLEVCGGEGDYRDVFMVAGEDPYAWKGYEERSFPHLRRCALTAAPPPRRCTLDPAVRLKIVDAMRRWDGDEAEAFDLLRAAVHEVEGRSNG